jgi:hypothetical protein
MTRASRRYWRTFILGMMALGTLVWAAVDQFGIPIAEINKLFLAIILGVVLVVLSAAAAILLWQGLRKLIRHFHD